MKILIWVVCIFVVVIVNTLLGIWTGGSFGQLITVPIAVFIASTLCRKWESRKELKELMKDK